MYPLANHNYKSAVVISPISNLRMTSPVRICDPRGVPQHKIVPASGDCGLSSRDDIRANTLPVYKLGTPFASSQSGPRETRASRSPSTIHHHVRGYFARLGVHGTYCKSHVSGFRRLATSIFGSCRKKSEIRCPAQLGARRIFGHKICDSVSTCPIPYCTVTF